MAEPAPVILNDGAHLKSPGDDLLFQNVGPGAPSQCPRVQSSLEEVLG